MFDYAALDRRANPPAKREARLCQRLRVAGRLRKARLAGRRITVRVRFPQMRSTTRSVTLSVAISTTLTLTEVAEKLARAAIPENGREREITLLAVSVSNLRPEHALQLELPIDSPEESRNAGRQVEAVVEASRWGVDRSVDAIRERFGRSAINYAAVAFSDNDRVPEEFRQLAEREPGGRQTRD